MQAPIRFTSAIPGAIAQRQGDQQALQQFFDRNKVEKARMEQIKSLKQLAKGYGASAAQVESSSYGELQGFVQRMELERADKTREEQARLRDQQMQQSQQAMRFARQGEERKEEERLRQADLARFLTTGKDPELTRADFISESIAPGKTLAQRGRGFDPDVRRGKKKLLPPSFYDPKSYERTPAPMELGPSERFQRIASDPNLDPRSKMEAMAQVKAEAAALAGPEQELDREMRLAAYKDQLGGATGPIDTTASDVTNDAIGRALPLISSLTTGFGAFLKGVPGTEAKTLDRLLATVRANVGFEKLAAMRRASPTGGALGNVSDKEIQFLQAVLGDLDQANDDVELTYNLKLVQHMFNNIVHGKGKDNAGNFYHPFRHPGDPTEAGGQPPAGGVTSEDLDALRQQIESKTALEAERATERRESAERLRDQAPGLPPSADPLIEDLRRQQGADAFRPPMGSPGLPPSTPQPLKPIDEVLKDVDKLIQGFRPGQ
jgi:hypothetical protein